MNTTNVSQVSMRQSASKVLVLCLLAAIAAAFFLCETARAQEGAEYDYVDLVMLYEYGTSGNSNKVAYIVQNAGTATATGVTVSFLLTDLQTYFPSVIDKRTDNATKEQRFIWEVGTILPGETSSVHLTFDTVNHTGHTTWEWIGVITATASSHQPEPGFLLANNVRKVYSYADSSTGSTRHMTSNRLGLLLSVDDLRPDAGGDVDFDLTARNFSEGRSRFEDAIDLIGDIEIKVELSDGLEFKEGWSRPTEFTTSGRSATWKPEAVDTWAGSTLTHFREIEIQTQLTSDSLDKIPLQERCITARVTDSIPPPSPDYALGSLKQCLGDDPLVLFEQGTLQAFTAYPCVDASGTAITSYPCDVTDSTSEVAVIAVADSDAHNPDPRLQGVARSSEGKVTLLPEQGITVQVKDPAARVVSGGTVTWQTGRATSNKKVPGVMVNFTAKDFVDTTSGKECPGATTCRWSNLARTVKVEGLPQGSDPPGGVKIKFDSATEFQHFDANSGNDYTSTRATWDLGQYVSNNISNYYLEFSKLGTHVVDFTAGVTRRSDSEVQEHTGTYTFHVGPIAELEVRDGGASPHAPAGRNALTIFAFNNGPDPSLGARVTGLPTGAEVLHISQGSYDGTDGVWNTGELEDRYVLGAGGRPEQATLVLSADAGDTADVTIKNSVAYTVCIGSDAGTLAHTTQTDCEEVTGASWHEGTVYDYRAANNTAKISTAKGTSGGGPGAPGMRGAKANSRSVTIAWDEVEYLHGVPVRHHEVQKYMADVEVWETVSGPVRGAQWTDFNVGSGAMPAYRVRAVNDVGVGGPWSAMFNRLTAQQQGQLAGPRLTAKWTAGDAIRLTWTEPSNQQDAITGYQLEYLAGDTWTLLASLAADETCADDTSRCYEDLGLPAGTERRYRVRAMAGQDPGRWSSEAVTATPPGAPVLWAEANGSNAILITWDPGSDAVTGFELEASSTGEDGPYSRLANPSGTTRSYSHNTGAINPEARYYRLRACNSAGCGHWSFPDDATTAPQGVPAAPGLTVQSSTASEIRLSWNKPDAGASEITHYELEHFTDGRNWTGLELYPATPTEYVHQAEFGGGTTHRYRVRAVNGEGNGAWSTVRSVSIAAGLPGRPELSFSDATDDSLTLSWTIPPTNGSRITGYRVERNDRIGGFDNWVRIGTTGASVTTYTDRNLYSGDWLCYRVVATSNVGTGAYSEEECESTTGQYAIDPDPPVLRLSGVSSNRVTIAWDPPPDDGGRPVQSYLYQRADENGEFDGSCQYASWDRDQWSDACQMVSTGTRTATFSNLTAGDSYQFRVRAETTYIYGDWATAYARLPAARDDSETDDVTEDLQVRLSTTTLTVNEGRGESRYTVRLNKAPKEGEIVPLDVDLSGALPDLFVDYEDERVCYGFEFNRENWNQGCVFTVSAREDRNADNEIAVVNHSIEVGGMEVTGPDVRIEVRDND